MKFLCLLWTVKKKDYKLVENQDFFCHFIVSLYLQLPWCNMNDHKSTENGVKCMKIQLKGPNPCIESHILKLSSGPD